MQVRVTNDGEGGATKQEGGGAFEVLALRKGATEKVLAMRKGRDTKSGSLKF